MTDYTVHEPPTMAATREERAEKLVFVPDKFSFLAAVFGLLYFIFRGHWFGAAIYLALLLAIQAILSTLGAGELWTAAFAFALNIIAGFEAHELQRWALDLRGWKRIGTTYGTSRDDAESRFIETWLAAEPLITPAAWQTGNARDRWSADAMEEDLRAFAAKLRQKYSTGTN